MPYDLFIRITHTYDECKHIVSRWAMECDKMAVYEHVGERTKKEHIHIAIKGSRVQGKQLRNIAKSVSQVSLKGNENCSMKEWKNNDTPLVYMTKGQLKPRYLRGWSEAEAEQWRSQWVEPTPKSRKLSEIQKLYEAELANVNLKLKWEEYNKSNPEISWHAFLSKYIWRLAYEHNNCFVSMKTINDNRSLFMTYCYRNGIKVRDKDHPMYKYFQQME